MSSPLSHVTIARTNRSTQRDLAAPALHERPPILRPTSDRNDSENVGTNCETGRPKDLAPAVEKSPMNTKLVLSFTAAIAVTLGSVMPALAWAKHEHPIGNATGINLSKATQAQADTACRNYINTIIMRRGGTFNDTVTGRRINISHANNTHKWAHRNANTCVVNDGFGLIVW
jgi:hypothetical protein